MRIFQVYLLSVGICYFVDAIAEPACWEIKNNCNTPSCILSYRTDETKYYFRCGSQTGDCKEGTLIKTIPDLTAKYYKCNNSKWEDVSKEALTSTDLQIRTCGDNSASQNLGYVYEGNNELRIENHIEYSVHSDICRLLSSDNQHIQTPKKKTSLILQYQELYMIMKNQHLYQV